MKEKVTNTIFIIITFVFLFTLFKNNQHLKFSIIKSFNLWLKNIVPTLFPMIIINDFLFNYNFPNIICNIFYKLFNKIFKLSYMGTYIFIMSLFIGTPANAILIKKIYDNNLIEIDELNKLLYTLYIPSPIFLYNMLSELFSLKFTIKIIISNYVINFIILFIFRNTSITSNSKMFLYNKKNFSNLLNDSLNKGINSMISILGIISFYILITDLFFNNIIMKGLFEITTGLNELRYINNPNIYILILFISFGGLSIFSQIKNALSGINLKYKNYFIGRLISFLLLCYSTTI